MDTVRQLHTVARFVRIPGCDEDRIRQAVDEHDFQRMRQRERSNAYGTDRIQARDPGDPDSYKTRRGKIGGYRDYLEPAACDEIDRYLADELDPLYVRRYIHPDADTGDQAGFCR